jgi:AAA15 family ATPase/GTPase
MLIRFSVGNFLSFNAVEEFSMISGKVRSKMNHIYSDDKLKLLKFASLFGANASGKSNLVSAIDFARKTVLLGLPDMHTMKYFKGLEANRDKNSYFEFEVKIGYSYYAYGFELILSDSSIKSEWLIELDPSGNDREIFTRDVESGKYSVDKYFKNKKLVNKLNLYADDIKLDDSILLLKIMNQNKDNFYNENEEATILKEMFRWIERKLDVNYPDRPISDYSYFMTDDNIDEISRVISAFGTGITKFKVVDVAPESIFADIPKKLAQDIISKLEKSNAKKKKEEESVSRILIRSSNKDFMILEADNEGKISSKTIKFNHGNDDVLFSLSEESDGTVRILDLLEILLDRKKDKTYIIDEIDRCLHPQLTYKFVETFLELAESRNIQLIVTSHESRLLDFNLLRRDEIWFAEKNSSGETRLYSLEEYNSRFDQKIDKAYLEGRYGGVPLFNMIFPLKGE